MEKDNIYDKEHGWIINCSKICKKMEDECPMITSDIMILNNDIKIESDEQCPYARNIYVSIAQVYKMLLK